MPTTKPFAYNTGSTISGTQQLGSIAVATGNTLGGSVTWWMGPDEDLGYVVAVPVSGNTQPTPVGVNASIGFFRSSALSDASFINLAQFLSNYTQTFANGSAAKTWLNNNGYWTSYSATTTTIDAKVEASYYSSSYYLHSDGTLYSWGDNSFGQLGDNTTVSKRTPVAVCGGLTYKDINAGTYHFLGITTTGVGYGWGYTNNNPDGWVINSNAIGNNVSTQSFYSTPVAICGGLTFSQVTAGQNFSLGLTTGGIGYGWGENFDEENARGGQLGIDSIDNKITPVAICGGLTFSQISAGRNHSLGLTTNGIAYVWGWGNGLGNSTNPSEFQSLFTPTAVCGGLTFCKISAGSNFSLGITTSGVAYAWGENNQGQLGVNDIDIKPTPVAVCGGLTFCQVSAGVQFSLGITTNGIAYAWGDNSLGQLGDNTTVSKRTPVAVCGGLTFSQISAGSNFSLGITTTGVVYAWGFNSYGQLGDNTTTSRLTPVAVCPKW